MDDPLLPIISTGDVSGLIQFLCKGKYSQKSLNRALRIAAFHGRTDCIWILLKAGSDINYVDKLDGCSPLIKAIHSRNFIFGNDRQRRSSLEVMDMLLHQGAEVDARCSDGSTALMAACGIGWTEGARVLISHGARVNATCDRNKTALNHAVLSGSAQCVELLLVNNAHIDHLDNDGATAVVWQAYPALQPPYCLDMFRHHSSYIQPPGGSGFTPLMTAAATCSAECVEVLLAYNADVRKSNTRGHTALSWALIKGQFKCKQDGDRILQLLAAAGADIGAYKHTPLPKCLTEFISNTDKSLMGLCRRKVRQEVLSAQRSGNLFHHVTKLGLPFLLSSYLVFDYQY